MYSENVDVIRQRMLNNITNEISKIEGTVSYDAVTGAAEEIGRLRIDLDEIVKRVFAISATENGYSVELENKAAEFGVYRKEGTTAKGRVKFYGADDTLIKKDTVIQTLTGLRYYTVGEGIIENGIFVMGIKAEKAGKQYNIPLDTDMELPVQTVGITSVELVQALNGGTDIETDKDLLDRFLLKVRTPATSGNAGHYKLWALEVPGVGEAVVLPLWNGPGTVKVVLLDSNKRTPSQEIIESAVKNIEEKRPVLAGELTVEGAEEVPIDIIVEVELTSYTNLEEVKELLEKSIKEYLETLAFKDSLVRYTRIANLILDIPPIIDYKNLLLNSETFNIEIKPGQVAILGNVVVTNAS